MRSAVVGACPEVLRMCSPSPQTTRSTPKRLRMISRSRDHEDMGREEQAAIGKVMTKEEFQGEWTAPAPKCTDSPPGVVGGCEGAGALGASPWVPR